MHEVVVLGAGWGLGDVRAALVGFDLAGLAVLVQLLAPGGSVAGRGVVSDARGEGGDRVSVEGERRVDVVDARARRGREVSDRRARAGRGRNIDERERARRGQQAHRRQMSTRDDDMSAHDVSPTSADGRHLGGRKRRPPGEARAARGRGDRRRVFERGRLSRGHALVREGRETRSKQPNLRRLGLHTCRRKRFLSASDGAREYSLLTAIENKAPQQHTCNQSSILCGNVFTWALSPSHVLTAENGINSSDNGIFYAGEGALFLPVNEPSTRSIPSSQPFVSERDVRLSCGDAATGSDTPTRAEA